MSHIDTLQVYKDYLGAGYTESQAVAAVKSLDNAFDHVVTIKDLKILENDLKIYFGNLVKGTMLITFIIPVVIGGVLKMIGVV